MRKILNTIDKFTTLLASVFIAIMIAILVYNVTARYFFGGGISWYSEGSQYLNIWAMFLAGVAICCDNTHLNVAFIDDLLKGKTKRNIKFLNAMLTTIFYILAAYSLFLLASKSRQTISTMPSLKMAYVYWPLSVLAALSAFGTICDAIEKFKNFKEENL